VVSYKRLIDYMKSRPTVSGVDAVLIPGEPERIARSDRMANGLCIDEVTWEGMLKSGEAVNFSREEVYKILAGAPHPYRRKSGSTHSR